MRSQYTCSTGSISYGNTCFTFIAAILMIILPLLAVVLCAVLIFFRHKQLQNEMFWVIQVPIEAFFNFDNSYTAAQERELKYDDPPVMIGSGSFGKVGANAKHHDCSYKHLMFKLNLCYRLVIQVSNSLFPGSACGIQVCSALR